MFRTPSVKLLRARKRSVSTQLRAKQQRKHSRGKVECADEGLGDCADEADSQTLGEAQRTATLGALDGLEGDTSKTRRETVKTAVSNDARQKRTTTLLTL